MNILFFGPFTYRARDNESLILKFKEQGHHVFFLTMEQGGYIIDFLSENNIPCYRMDIKGNGKLALLKKVLYFIRFIKKHRIDTVFSHLEPANFIAVLAQPFVKSRIVIVRHHSDLFYINNLHKLFSYRYSYRNAKEIIAVSEHAKKVMVDKEKIDGDKITVINLAYNFDLFEKASINEVELIRKQYDYDLLLLSVGRLVKNKRLDISIDVLKKLIENGHSVGLLILGNGELETELQSKIELNNLAHSCHLLGFKTNVMDYLAACDILVHPSESESSSVIVKEAGIQKKVIIGCYGVGDCDDYIVNGENGFLIDKDNFVNEAVDIIEEKLVGKTERKRIGENLYTSVEQLFSIENNIGFYQKYLS